jgi:hypothetical protein
MTERVFIDRIEGGRAVLLFGEEGRETGSIPARLLPESAREGDALDFTLTPAPQDTTRQEVQDLFDDLFSDSSS